MLTASSPGEAHGQITSGFPGTRSSGESLQRKQIFWEDTPQHKFETVIDGIGVVPVVGVLAVGDEILAFIKHSDLVFELRTLGKLEDLLDLEGVYYLNKMSLSLGSAGCMLQEISPATYRKILETSDRWDFYKLQYGNPIAEGFGDCADTVRYLEAAAPETLEEIIEGAAKQSGKSANEVEEFVEEALENARKKVDGGGGIDFKNQDLLDSHYNKHANEFFNISKEEQVKGANK